MQRAARHVNEYVGTDTAKQLHEKVTEDTFSCPLKKAERR